MVTAVVVLMAAVVLLDVGSSSRRLQVQIQIQMQIQMHVQIQLQIRIQLHMSSHKDLAPTTIARTYTYTHSGSSIPKAVLDSRDFSIILTMSPHAIP